MRPETIKCAGAHIQDKHTHYELYTHLGPYPLTVIIPGYVADDFQAKYGKPMQAFGEISFSVEYSLRNDELVPECRDPYKPAAHRRTTINSVGQVKIEKEE